MSVTYLMLTDEFKDNALFSDRYHTLSPARQKKIDGFIFSKDKNLSLAAGLLFQAGLKDYGLREQELTIADNENGKPFIREQPELFFNISHSENFKLAVCTKGDSPAMTMRFLYAADSVRSQFWTVAIQH